MLLINNDPMWQQSFSKPIAALIDPLYLYYNCIRPVTISSFDLYMYNHYGSFDVLLTCSGCCTHGF